MYGKGEVGGDIVENLTYTVFDGIATLNYNGQKIATTKIENDTFKASLDGTEENTASFTTKANPAPAKPETPVKPTDPEKPAEPTDPEKPTEPTDPETPVENPFAGKTFYGTGYGSSYDICKLDFTSDLKATLTYYGLGEAGDDLVFNSTYTVSDGIATLDYQGDKVTTTKIENDTFKVSKDGTEEHAISFTTKANPAPAKPETPVEPTDPETPVEPTDPETPAENPFAGKTFYGTVDGYPYDVCKLDFISDSEVTLTLYGEGEAGADVVLDLTYTVSDGIATVDYEGQKLTTTKIENDTFKASLDGTEENTASFTTNANPAPAEPETPVEPVLKTAAGYNCTKGQGTLEWVDGVAVLQFELPADYGNNWIYPDNPNNSFSFYLETVAGSWKDDCYKAAQTVEIGGEEVDLEIGTAGNNTVTSAESLAGKTLKLTFTGTETAIKCKAEIVE